MRYPINLPANVSPLELFLCHINYEFTDTAGAGPYEKFSSTLAVGATRGDEEIFTFLGFSQ